MYCQYIYTNVRWLSYIQMLFGVVVYDELE